MIQELAPAHVDGAALQAQVQAKYRDVATNPSLGFHFHTGAPLAAMLGYAAEDVGWLPLSAVESFAGTGNPLSMGTLREGATVLDVGSGSGFDTLLAARQVGPSGRVVAVDMTPEMLANTRRGAAEVGLTNVEVREGMAQDLPVDSGEFDYVISNGVINLCPDKMVVLSEIVRVLKPTGQVQIADIVVHRPVPQEAKDDIDLWSG